MTRSSSRARTSERGFALIAALMLAVLYFGLMELMLIDSTRELQEAQRFRARVVATALAENAAELAAQGIMQGSMQQVAVDDATGMMTARREGALPKFDLIAEAETKGPIKQRATLLVRGEVYPYPQPTSIRIDYTFHSQ